MRLYVVQHGHALAREVDPDRPLSEQGRCDVERVGAFLARAGVGVRRVVHSGKTRARETAGLLAEAIAPDGPIESRSGLGPQDDPRPVAEEIETWDRDGMLVGHLPFVGRLVSLLCAAKGGEAVVDFLPGSVVCVERRDEGGWRVSWMIRPELVPRD